MVHGLLRVRVLLRAAAELLQTALHGEQPQTSEASQLPASGRETLPTTPLQCLSVGYEHKHVPRSSLGPSPPPLSQPQHTQSTNAAVAAALHGSDDLMSLPCLPPVFVCGPEEAQNWLHDLAQAGCSGGLHLHGGGLRLMRSISVPAMRTTHQLLQGLWHAAVPVERALWLVGGVCVVLGWDLADKSEGLVGAWVGVLWPVGQAWWQVRGGCVLACGRECSGWWEQALRGLVRGGAAGTTEGTGTSEVALEGGH
eukprot:1131408-Pelagomonas_calceolata.AAC.3